MSDLSRKENLAELLEMEDLLSDAARFKQWQKDVKGELHIDRN